MQTLRSWSAAIVDRCTGRVALAGLVVFLLFGALVLPGQAVAAEQASAGAGSPDTSFFYKPDELLRQAEAYGEAGRAAYVRARWTFDLAFPLVYGFFLVTSIGWCLRRAAPPSSAWRLLSLVPVAAVLFDFLENTATSLVMSGYPAVPGLALILAPWMTPVKWILVYASFGILAVALAAVLLRKLRRLAE
ncbi:MAG: hypothetical protein FJZ97_03750 [Chloroflexi bacterium]|nr:hypothetical protein [Chloroflexota bacterium]